jgi:hypothetical protein
VLATRNTCETCRGGSYPDCFEARRVKIIPPQERCGFS